VVQWIDVTGHGIDDIHDEMLRVAVDVIESVGDKEVGHLWTDVIDDLRTDSSS